MSKERAHKPGCPACSRIAAVQRGEADPHFIRELPLTLAFLHGRGPYQGWCVLFLKRHEDHLADLPAQEQADVFKEVAQVAGAVRAVCSPARINYECLGNQLAHVHWHIIPRYARPLDPDPGNAVWARSASELRQPVDPGEAAGLVLRLQDAMRRVGARRHGQD